MGVGFGLGNLLRRRADTERLRLSMLCVVAVSALGPLVQAVLS